MAAGSLNGARPPAVLHVDGGREWRGGQRQVLLAATGMAARGGNVLLAAPPGSPLAERAAARGLTVAPLPVRGDLDIVAAARLARLARAHGASIVHAHCARTHGVARLAGTLGRGWRLVVTRRAAPPRASRHAFSRLKYSRGVDRYIAISGAVRDELIRAGAAPDRVRVVPSGVDPPAAVTPVDWRQRLGIPADSLVIGSVGALTRGKGHHDLVAALAAVGDRRLHLVVAGAGPRAEALHDLAAGLGVAEQVHLIGFVEDVSPAIAGLDIYAQPSLAEGLGTAVLDAMGLGRPVVATQVGGLAELIVTGESGVLVRAGAPAELATAITRLAADPALRDRLAGGARRRAADFSVDAMVEGTLRVYHELLGPA